MPPRGPTPREDLLPGQAQDADEHASAHRGQLQIVIIAGNKPVPSADVHVYRREDRFVAGDSWRSSAKGVTDAAGTLLVAASPGTWLVTATARGFARAYAEAVRPAGEDVTKVELRLQPGASVLGRTVERRGEAVIPLVALSCTPAPTIRFRRTEFPAEERIFSTSDGRGLFRLSGLAPGRWRVEARAPGHAPAYVHFVVPAAEELRVELAGAASIEGLVTRDGQPVPRAVVTVTGSGEPVTVDSGPTGEFLAEVDPGTHHAFARSGDETGTVGHAIVVAAGTHARGIELRLGPAARIGGWVRSATGPVAGAAVTASPYNEGALAQAVTDPTGNYEIRGLAPGSYTVAITAHGRAGATYSAITLRNGERFPLNATLADPNAVEGTVSDSNGAPVLGALVSAAGGWFRGLGGAGTPSSAAARTDSSGHYRLEGVPAGPLRVSAQRDEASPASVRTVNVEEGASSQVDLVLPDGGLVVGVVLDSRANPIPGALVSAIDPSGFGRRGVAPPTTADAAGSYLLALPPGSYGLSAWRPDRAGGFGVRPPILGSAKVAVGARVELNLVVPDDPPPTVSGQVLEPGGAPSPGAMLRVGAFGPGMQLVTAASDGTFAISVAGPDPITISARNGGRTGSATVSPPATTVVVQLQPAAEVQGKLLGDPSPETFSLTSSTTGAVPIGGPSQSQFVGSAFTLQDVASGAVTLHATTDDGRVGDAQVTVAPGEEKSVDVVLSPAATVAGRVVDASTGQPVTRGRILVDGVARRGSIGTDGRFSRTVSAGDHQIGVNAPGYVALSRAVSAHAGAPNDIGDFQLSPAPGQAIPSAP
jgi:protocatechuate 3,4-dioxygenase beta subunit